MGTTIYYGGTAKRGNEGNVLRYIEDYAMSNEWQINRIENNSIMISPHPDCETLAISFDEKHTFSGFVKTGFCPFEIHQQVVKLFYQIKPMLRQFKIEDESGYWLELIEQASGNTAKELTEFPEVSEKDIVNPELLQLPVSASEFDQRYWNSNPKYMRPFMHIPTIRDRMGYDLMTGPYLLIAEEMGQLLRNEGFIVDSSDWQNDEFYLINLATWWAWTRSSGMKATALRRNKCQAFGWALARGCHGFHGGFLNQTHRRAHLAIDNLEQREGEASPLRSIQILYGLFAYVGLK